MIPIHPWQAFATGYPAGRLETLVARHAAAAPRRLAVICEDERIDWETLDDRADRLAAWCVAQGLVPGDRIGWLGRNRPAFPAALVAARRAGLVLVGLNWRLAAPELATVLRAAGCRVILADPEFAPLLPASVPAHDPAALLPTLSAPPAEWRPHEPAPETPTTLFFTSGTTGTPKGLLYSSEGVERAVASPHTLDFDADARLLIVAPVFHTAGWMWCQYGLAGGLTQVLLPAAVPDAMVAAVAEHDVTHAQWVPTMLANVLDAAVGRSQELNTLRLIAYGAAPIQPSLLARAQAQLGCDFCQVYGLTETIAPISHLPPAAHHGAAAQATGAVNPGVTVTIRTAAGDPLPAGATGEIWVRMPHAAARRWDTGDPVTNPGGWIRTGDAGRFDANGYLQVQDRIGDMIISGAENIYPAEVEAALAEAPGVREAAAFGLPDPRWGQRVAAAVSVGEGATFDADAIIASCRERLAHYKCPREVRLVTELPRNATGKILRRALAAQFGAATPD